MLFREELLQIRWECIHFVSSGEETTALVELEKSDSIIFKVHGAQFNSEEDLLNVLAKEMKFPDYFGTNWDALDECLRDMSWLPAKQYVLFFYDAKPLWQRSPQVAGKLIESWLFSAEEWSRQGVSFHLVFIW